MCVTSSVYRQARRAGVPSVDTSVWVGVLLRVLSLGWWGSGGRRGAGAGVYSRRSSLARATASVRRCTPSFSKMRRLCPFTVSKARKSRVPISRFERP
jgi:hypothetical protein